MNFKNNEPCKICKGQCCKNMAGHLSPDDLNFEITFDNIKKLLDEGLHSIDWWNNYNNGCNGYFIRLRNKNAPIIDPAWVGECILLTKNGCPLEFEKRPKACRKLLAAENSCKSYYTKHDVANDWWQYYDILLRLKKEYQSDEDYDLFKVIDWILENDFVTIDI